MPRTSAILSQSKRAFANPGSDAARGCATIAIVDDNPGDIELVIESIRHGGRPLRVNGYPTGPALFAALEVEPPPALPAAVLIDLNMPGMDGRAVLARLKSHPALRAVPAIVYSSSTLPSERQCCLELGADDYIVKPASFDDCDEVLRRIAAVIERRTQPLAASRFKL